MENKGQSLIEAVVAIGLVIVVITGIVALVVYTVGARTKSYERTKATELAQVVLESMVAERATAPVDFWNLNSSFWQNKVGVALTWANFGGYEYVVNIVPESNFGCTAATCFNVTVSVGWSGSPGGARDTFSRFFSRK